MKDSAASPLRGRYLVRHRLLNVGLRLIDGVLGLRRRASPPPISSPRRLLVANIAHLGDALLATSVLPVLRDAFPGVHIGFLASSGSRPVLEGHPLVDALHFYDHARLDRRGGSLAARMNRHVASRQRAVAALRAGRYDVAIDLYPYFPNAIPLLTAAGIPVRIGYTSGGFGPLLTHPVDWSLRDWHVTEYHAHLLTRLPLPRPIAGVLRPVLADAAPQRPEGLPARYLIVHPGAGAAFKEWPIDHWWNLIAELRAGGHELVFTGAGDREAAMCKTLIAGQDGCLDLCGRLDWARFVAVVRHAQVVVGVDSVAGHVAAAVGTPCVVLATGIPHPMHWAPSGPAVRVLRRPVPCAPCYRSRGCAEMTCVRGIEVAEAAQAIAGLLGQTGTRAA